MNKRYQIFISSTYSDLIVERDKVTQAVLELDCFPTGMEIFPAAGVPPKNLIEKALKGCDYYLLIIGARYGSLTDKGISFTEWEYDIAVESNIPVLAFLHNDINSIPLGKTDEDKALLENVKKFRKKVENGGQTVKYWINPDDLKAKVLLSIPRAIELQPQTGWVRAFPIVNGDHQKEIDSLKKEIANRQNEVKRLESELKKKDTEYLILETKYQTAQLEIDNNKETIKSLEMEIEGLKESPLPLTELFNAKGVSFRMVHVEGGTFMMGADDDEAISDEKPAHEVTLSDYWIGETPVTQALWCSVMETYLDIDDFDTPVVGVSWDDCREFIRKLNRLTRKKFRFPTEAEWEFAARGGKLGMNNHYQFAGSNNISDVAWYEDNSDRRIHPVGELDSNELGLYDMSGNVWEWCNDWYADYYGDEITVNPLGPVIGYYRVCRGGNYIRGAEYCRVSDRFFFEPWRKYNYLGLRLAL